MIPDRQCFRCLRPGRSQNFFGCKRLKICTEFDFQLGAEVPDSRHQWSRLYLRDFDYFWIFEDNMIV